MWNSLTIFKPKTADDFRKRIEGYGLRRETILQKIAEQEGLRREHALAAADGDDGAQSQLDKAGEAIGKLRRDLEKIDLAIGEARAGLDAALVAAAVADRARLLAEYRKLEAGWIADAERAEKALRELASALDQNLARVDPMYSLLRQLHPSRGRELERPLDPDGAVGRRLHEFAAGLGLGYWFRLEVNPYATTRPDSLVEGERTVLARLDPEPPAKLDPEPPAKQPAGTGRGRVAAALADTAVGAEGQ